MLAAPISLPQYCLKHDAIPGSKEKLDSKARHSWKKTMTDRRRDKEAHRGVDHLLQAVDVDLAPRIRNRCQIGTCGDIHFPICDHRRAEFDSVSRRVAAVRGAAIEL